SFPCDHAEALQSDCKAMSLHLVPPAEVAILISRSDAALPLSSRCPGIGDRGGGDEGCDAMRRFHQTTQFIRWTKTPTAICPGRTPVVLVLPSAVPVVANSVGSPRVLRMDSLPRTSTGVR
ncbi:unnamed protein product, partial [Phaeothamnion confervicola]